MEEYVGAMTLLAVHRRRPGWCYRRDGKGRPAVTGSPVLTTRLSGDPGGK